MKILDRLMDLLEAALARKDAPLVLLCGAFMVQQLADLLRVLL